MSFVQAAPEDAALDAGAPYDAALAFNLLHLIEDLPGTLRRTHDLLKPGGMLISKTPCLDGLLFRLMLPVMLAFFRLRYGAAAPHVGLWTPDTLEQAFEEAGFEIVEAESIPKGNMKHFVVARRKA